MSLARKLLQAVVDSIAPEKKEDAGRALMLRPAAPLTRPDADALMIRPERLAQTRQGYCRAALNS